jgi:hypothetical protein
MPLHCLTPLFRVRIEVVAVVVLVGIPQATSAGARAKIPRVRPNDNPAIARLLDEGTTRSATFRRLVETIDATDGLVYVQEGRCGHNVRACLALSVQVAGPNRILRIVVDTRRDHDELIAAIGHELQHAVEVLSDPHVRNDPTIYFFFDRIGPTARERFETRAAIRAGTAVLAELRARQR